MKKISIIGFGKIGQALAANIVKRQQGDVRIVAVDTDLSLQQSFAEGSYTSAEPGLQEILLQSIADNSLVVSADYSRIVNSDGVIIAIPLLVDEQKKLLDKSFIECIQKLSPYCTAKTLVIIETSVPVGYCRNTVVPVLERTGKRHGEDFLLAYSPERIKSGTMLEQLQRIPKIIGGMNEEAARQAGLLYQSFFNPELITITENIETAEMIKLAGMIYRDVNIALANQLAQYSNAMAINFADIISLINSDNESGILHPGIGVGGHCTPVYPHLLIENFKQAGLDFTLARQGREINNAMAGYAIDLVKDKVGKKQALILGVGFRPNVKEDTLSVTYRLQAGLVEEGFGVQVHDTEYSVEELLAKGLQPVDDIYSTPAEVVFLVTMHRQYGQLDFVKMADAGIRYFVDGRNSIDRKEVEAAGIIYLGIGR